MRLEHIVHDAMNDSPEKQVLMWYTDDIRSSIPHVLLALHGTYRAVVETGRSYISSKALR